MKKIKILCSVMLLSLIIPSLSFARAEDVSGTSTKKGPGLEMRVENREQRIEGIMQRASTTERRLENRENNIERIRERIASTIASTTASSTKRLEKLDNRLQKQQEQMGKVRERLVEKELKVTDVLGKIASKIQARIDILVTKGLDMTAAKAKLALAATKIEEMTAEVTNLTTLIETEVTTENQATLFTSIRASQDKIKVLAKETHALLVDTVKEITKVLPKNGRATSTASTTATSTN
jgi:hypothetical protein